MRVAPTAPSHRALSGRESKNTTEKTQRVKQRFAFQLQSCEAIWFPRSQGLLRVKVKTKKKQCVCGIE